MTLASPVSHIPHPLNPPDLLNSFTEAARAGFELALSQLTQAHVQRITPDSESRPIIVIPGFLGADWTTANLRGFLMRKGHDAYGWHGGINTGPSERVLEHLDQHLDMIANAHHGQKITLIGHSLGGVFAREMARAYPQHIEQVITLGSPFAAGLHPNGVNPLVKLAFALMNGRDHFFMTDKEFARLAATPPPVPTTSIYSRGDGVVHWKTCLNPPAHKKTQDIEVIGSHCGLVVNPLAMIVCADRLANADAKRWKPFVREAYSNFLFPEPHTH
jgi:pimeloyl-ACP methyl ester carboxylesterase